jgi:tetratricopeptide (TPR) repeat protein
MAIVNLFSKRQRKLRGDVPDIYTYDSLPPALKVQITYIWNYHLGKEGHTYEGIVRILCCEYGVENLCNIDWDAYKDLERYFFKEIDIERNLDIVELIFQRINTYKRNERIGSAAVYQDRAERAINELNDRFKEHGIGFQFEGNEIIKMDSEFLHVETVKPALRLLDEKNYKDAQDEFLNAHEQYRHGKNKEAMNACLRSFESIMKSICNKHKWHYEKQATAKSLIDVCIRNNLIPSFWENPFKGLQSTLKGVLEGRNKLSGHADEPEELPPPIPNYLVAYMLHMTASNIVLLTSAEKELKIQ